MSELMRKMEEYVHAEDDELHEARRKLPVEVQPKRYERRHHDSLLEHPQEKDDQRKQWDHTYRPYQEVQTV